jgi:hypothetical protein
MSEKSEEARARRIAARHGYRVYKSRERSQHMNNKGLFMLTDFNNNVVFGRDFDASPEDIIQFVQRACGGCEGEK